MKKLMLIAMVMMSGVVMSAENGDEKSEGWEKPPAFGKMTSDWLEMQRSGREASDNPQAATPVIQEKVIKRYVDSYNHSIPEFYERAKFMEGGK